MEKIKNFTDLNAWKEGHRLVLMIYKSIAFFPKEEKFGIIAQMSRAVVSITSNIAEGFTRLGRRDKANFYCVAKASLTELQNQLIISKDLNYLKNEDFGSLWSQTVIVHKLITGLIKGIIKLHYS